MKRVGASNARAALRMFPAVLQLNDGTLARKVLTRGTPDELGGEVRVPTAEFDDDGNTTHRLQRASRTYIMTVVYKREGVTGAVLPPRKGIMVRRAGVVEAPVATSAPVTAEELAQRFSPPASTSIQRQSNTVAPKDRAAFLQARAAEFKPAGEERFRENLKHVERALTPGEYMTNASFTPNLLDDATWATGVHGRSEALVDVGVEVNGKVTPARAKFELYKHRHEVMLTVKLGTGTWMGRIATGTLRSMVDSMWSNNVESDARIGVILKRGNQYLHTVLTFDKLAQSAMRAWLGTMENARFGELKGARR